MPNDPTALKQRAAAAIQAQRERLITVSDTIHANPELAFKEVKSAALLCDTLEGAGFAVQRGVGDLPTAFRAEAAGKKTGPTIAILAEYDALPKIGHACGHNIIGTAAIGAGIGVKAVIDELPGRVLVIGTPAEESGAGKAVLIERGVFADVDAAIMMHPAGYTMVTRPSLAAIRLDVEFTGKAAHAASSPDLGISALEAVIQTFNNVNSLRLHVRPDTRIHGIVTNGGAAINIIPEFASAAFSIRSLSQVYTEKLVQRVIACAAAAATATGARLKTSTTSGYAAMIPNPTMARLMAANLRSLGVEVHDPRPNERMGSTDMGNVTQVVPGIHAYVAISPENTAGHSVEFCAASKSPEGHRGLINAAVAMAMTVVEMLNDPALVAAAKQELAAAKAADR